MQTHLNVHYTLEAEDKPTVTSHEGVNRVSVSLFFPGYQADGRGFSLEFLPAHIPLLEDVITRLEALRS